MSRSDKSAPKGALFFQSIEVQSQEIQQTREFSVVIEGDSDGVLVASVPNLRGCHTQASSQEELLIRIKEAIELCLEVVEDAERTEFVGVQRVAVSA